LHPRVLIVEDNPDILEMRKVAFQESDFDPIGASNYNEALREFRSHPDIALVATDINLDPKDDFNQDGYRVAEDIKSIVPELPIVVISGRVSEAEFEHSNREQLFIDRLLKATGKAKFKERLPKWRNLALEFLHRKVSRGEAELMRLRQKYSISDYDFDLMREFIPTPSGGEEKDRSEIEGFISSRGYRLKIIETTAVPDVCAKEGISIAKAIPVWLHKSETVFIAELYGFPQIYASGSTETEAVQSMLFLMHGYFSDLATDNDASQKDSRLVKQFHAYVASVFSSPKTVSK
jgi:CheY-like chemotaxis protein